MPYCHRRRAVTPSHWPLSKPLIEALVIVGSILLAFAIDAAWDNRQDDLLRTELLRALDSDFRTTKGRLEVAIEDAGRMYECFEGFLSASDGSEEISADSIRVLASQALRTVYFEPELSGYEALLAMGGPNVVERREIWRRTTDFLQALEAFREHNRLYRDVYFLGAIMDLRRELGSLRLLYRTPGDRTGPLTLSDEEYREFVRKPETYAAMEAASFPISVVRQSLDTMNRAVDEILAELEDALR